MGCDFTIHVGKIPIKYEDEISLELDCEKACSQPHIVVGECSFLKAGLFDDDSFIPEPIRVLSEIIPSYGSRRTRKIDDELIKEVKRIEWINTTDYELYITKEQLLDFLEMYKGEECYYVCW